MTGRLTASQTLTFKIPYRHHTHLTVTTRRVARAMHAILLSESPTANTISTPIPPTSHLKDCGPRPVGRPHRLVDRETGGDVLVMDPMRLTPGIEPSADPILHVRRHAYAVSVEQRTETSARG